MSLFIEKHYPFFLSVAIMVIGNMVFLHYSEIKLRYDIFATTISIGSILLGFLVTTLSILFAISSSTIIKELKQSGAYRLITRYLMSAINSSFLALVINLIGLLIPLRSGISRYPEEIYIFSVWIFSTALPIIATQRALWLLNKMIQNYK